MSDALISGGLTGLSIVPVALVLRWSQYRRMPSPPVAYALVIGLALVGVGASALLASLFDVKVNLWIVAWFGCVCSAAMLWGELGRREVRDALEGGDDA